MANAQRYFVWLEFHGTKDYSTEKIHKFLKRICKLNGEITMPKVKESDIVPQKRNRYPEITKK